PGFGPGAGVHAGGARGGRRGGQLGPGARSPAASSVGTNATFDDVPERVVEAHVLDRDDLDLYGRTVDVEFVSRIRGMVAFDGLEPLIAQMHDDVEQTRAVLR